MSSHDAKGQLIMLAQANFNRAQWWQLALCWVRGRHRVVCHLGYTARIGFWRDQPYLLSFRENPAR